MNQDLRFKNNSGFTFVEVVVAGFITAVVVVGAGIFWRYVTQTYQFSLSESQSVEIAQSNVTLLIQELRVMRDGEDGSYPLITANDNAIVFFSDVNNDGKSERMRYFLDGQQLKRGIIQPLGTPATYPPASEKIKVIADSVATGSGTIFHYYNSNWPADTTNNPLPLANRLLQTRYIDVSLTIAGTPRIGAQPVTIHSATQLRNLKDNL